MSASVEIQCDCMGRFWSITKLDKLLADPAVKASAMAILAVGLRPDNGFDCGRALNVAKMRYRRLEPAALLAVLAARLWLLRAEGGLNDASR